jgi:capsular polysaccharide biosynthesis protein
MSEQAIDLRSTWATLRRRAGLLVLAASVGAAGGAGAAYLRPATFSSTSIVLLPSAPPGSANAATSHSIDTQVQIAMSEAVLGPAGQAISPQLTPSQVRARVKVESSTTDVLTINAAGMTAREAEALSSAVATAEIDYLEAAASSLADNTQSALAQRAKSLNQSLTAVSEEIKKTQSRISQESAASPAGKADATALAALTAQQANLVLQLDQIEKSQSEAGQPTDGASSAATIIQKASPAKRTPLALRFALFPAVGAAFDLLLACTILLVRGRRERTRRSRDEIADAVGIPVVASIQSHAPRSAAGWTAMLKGYTPDNVEMWTLRQLLRLVMPGHPGSLAESKEEAEGTPHVLVLTLAGDLQALAFGPQLASFAASTGLRTRLIAAQTHDSGDALWAACAGVSHAEQLRPGLSVQTRAQAGATGDLAVDLAVMDRVRPVLHVHGSDPVVTLLAVTAATATAEELARAALAADDAGESIDRIVVIDPDPLDRTTGRLAPAGRAQLASLPSLMTGSEIAGEATALEARRRLR